MSKYKLHTTRCKIRNVAIHDFNDTSLTTRRICVASYGLRGFIFPITSCRLRVARYGVRVCMHPMTSLRLRVARYGVRVFTFLILKNAPPGPLPERMGPWRSDSEKCSSRAPAREDGTKAHPGHLPEGAVTWRSDSEKCSSRAPAREDGAMPI